MDGGPSAPDADPEPFELTEGSSRSSDIERELNELRARAYSLEADIDADPVAVARLIELEAAHSAAAAGARATGSAASGATALPAERAIGPTEQAARRGLGRAWSLAGAIVVFAVVVAAAAWDPAPPPDATLQQIPAEADSDIIRVLSAQGRGLDAATLRRFERYHDVGVWSVENRAGKVCFVVWDLAASGRFSIKCAPPGSEVALSLSVESEGGDGFGPWLPDGSTVDFHFRENTVDVFVRPPAG